MDAFKDRLSERARDTGTHDYTAVAAALAERALPAPMSGRTDWTEALLAEELTAINADLDAAYEANGYGA
jgi:hypothetical protein